jgi:hypothetical protein
MLAGEQELRPLTEEVSLECRLVPSQLRGQLLVAGLLDQLERRQEVVGAGFEVPPQLDLIA